MATEIPFKPFTPAVGSLAAALVTWMRAFVHRYAGVSYRVTFEQRGAVPATPRTPAVEPTEYRINIFTLQQSQRNGVSFTSTTITGLAEAIDIEAPKFNRRQIRTR